MPLGQRRAAQQEVLLVERPLAASQEVLVWRRAWRLLALRPLAGAVAARAAAAVATGRRRRRQRRRRPR